MTDTDPLAALEAAVSNALSAATEGSDYAEAPEPSDEPGSPYVKHIVASLIAAGVTLAATPAPLDEERLTAAIERVLQDSDSRIGGPYAPLDSPIISVRFDRPAYAAAIATAYAEEPKP